MTEENYKKLQEEGFDQTKFDNYLKINLLMIRACELMSDEMLEYLDAFGLTTVSVKNNLTGMNGRFKKLADKIKPKSNDLNMDDYFKSYNKFIELIESFRDGE